jgi:hypothetical protein
VIAGSSPSISEGGVCRGDSDGPRLVSVAMQSVAITTA